MKNAGVETDRPTGRPVDRRRLRLGVNEGDRRGPTNRNSARFAAVGGGARAGEAIQLKKIWLEFWLEKRIAISIVILRHV